MQPLVRSINPQKLESSIDNKQIEYSGHSYSIEAIVEKVLLKEKNEYQKMLEADSDPFLSMSDSKWEEKKQFYVKAEKSIRENSDKIPTWQVTGSLNYGMSIEQMRDGITKKFKEMALSGSLMTEEHLTKNHERKIFYPTTGKGGNNLTRIWGAEFLKSNLLNHKTLNVADHFLIVDDAAIEIEVQVYHGEYPYLSIVNNAYVIAKKIDGIAKAWEYRFSEKLAELRYNDFKDQGNIIQDSQGIGWIVDTELKSFDPPKLSRNSMFIQDYLKKRFEVLVGDYSLYHTFKISVADLKLK